MSLNPPLPPLVNAVRSAHVMTISSGDGVRSFSRADFEEVREDVIWEEIWERRSVADIVEIRFSGLDKTGVEGEEEARETRRSANWRKR